MSIKHWDALPDDVREWLFRAPESMDIDVGVDGGQPNGVGVLESSDNRDWFSLERESHHRLTVDIEWRGAWEEGARDWVTERVERVKAQRGLNEEIRQQAVLDEAARILARRAEEGQ